MTTIDRAALESAMDIMRSHLGERCGDAGRTVLAAAEAHLATLPKTRTAEYFKIVGELATASSCGTTLEATNVTDLGKQVTWLVHAGFSKITITTEKREVPA